MSQKIKYKAFIKDNTIKITSGDGMDFDEQIERNTKTLKKSKTILSIFFFGLFIPCVIAIALINLFSISLPVNTVALGVTTGITFVGSFFSFLLGSETETEIMQLKNSKNLAYTELQNEILELEKKLLNHQLSLKNQVNKHLAEKELNF